MIDTPSTNCADTAAVKFPGVPIVLGGDTLIVPSLSLRQLKLHRSKIDSLDASSDGLPSPETIETIVDLAHAAISRNYPAFERDDLDSLIDLSNLSEVIAAVLKSGKGDV